MFFEEKKKESFSTLSLRDEFLKEFNESLKKDVLDTNMQK